jgi:carboxyl-terminal processing protease
MLEHNLMITFRNKHIVGALTLILVFSCYRTTEGLRRSDVQYLVQQFLARHVEYRILNNKISERTLNNFLDILDAGKYYFYKQDINEFMKSKYLIDDYIVQNQYSFVFKVYELYKKRFNESMKIADELISRDYDFTKDETMIIDRDIVDYATNKREMRERWRKNIKLQLLNYVSAGKSIDEARSKLRKRYKLVRNKLESLDEEQILSRFVNSFSMALDPHSNYLTYDEHVDFKISMELKLEGIGVRLRAEDGFTIVDAIIPGGATSKLPDDIRLKPNDKIVAVAQGDGEADDIIDMDLRDVVKKIRGKKGTEVRLTILRKTEESTRPVRMVVPIVREVIKLQDSDADSEVQVMKYRGKNIKIGYLKLPSFYFDPATRKSSAGDVRMHLNRLMGQNVKGIVLDLRNNPGGSLNEAVKIAGLFIDTGPVVQIKQSGLATPLVMRDNDAGTYYDGPLVVLVDKFSASASEILAGAIRDYRRGIILGPSKTFGKGTVQSYHVLANRRGAVKITTHIFYQPSGTSNQIDGITPDIIIPDISSVWNIGESEVKYPLVWKRIPRAPFNTYNLANKGVIASLTRASRARVKADDKYQKLIERIEKLKKQVDSKTVSLKDETNIEKQKEQEFRKKRDRDQSDKLIDFENDLFLKEAFNVTVDYLKALRKI